MPSSRRSATKPATTRKSTPVRKSATSRPSRSGTSRARGKSGGVLAHSPARQWSWNRLSLDRKLDIVGVMMALVGLLTLLSLISSNTGAVTGWWVKFIAQIAGWGSFILPVALVLVGVWLVLRNVERLPMLSAERLTGLILFYLNILAWLHLIGGGGMELAQAGEGGGYVGMFFQQLTVGALGEAGAIVAFSAWSIIAIALTLDISVQEIFNALQRVLASLARRINARLASENELRLAKQAAAAEEAAAAQAAAFSSGAGAVPHSLPVRSGQLNGNGAYVPELDNNGQPVSSELPPDFRPLNNGRQAGNAGAAANAGANPRSGTARPGVAGTAAGTAGTSLDSAPAVGAKPSVTHTSTPLPPWKTPAVDDILDPAALEATQINKDEEDRRKQVITETLASFGAPVKVLEPQHGPTITMFPVEPLYVETRNGKTRVRVSKIVALADDLALALAAQRIRIQAPVPGRNYVGIEVPNQEISRVTLRDVMESEAFRKLNKLKLPMRFALGKDVAGNSKAYDLAGMPHLLIAGTTGSGKSVLVNAILSCLLLNNTPNELRMILVDPKRVELTGYNGIPHLLAPVIVEAEQVVGALQWVQREMDARYHRFSQVGARNIVDYNARNSPPLPYMLVLIDELADLMMLAPDETERSLTRLAQLARATGIHLVLATQRPSVDVVTGLIKANFPARVAFAVASGIDSRVILDQPGAERLLGRGDMLFQAPDAAAPVRLQGVWVADAEIQRLIDYWRQQAYDLKDVNLHVPTATPVNMDMPLNAPLKQSALFNGDGDGKASDPVLPEAIRIVREEGRASISMLQRKMRIGYTRAARLIDALEAQGIVGPAVSTSQVREVLDFGDDKNAEAENHIGSQGD